ncbi:MAG: VOC family protein [Acidobacteriota bacterium]
MAKLQKISPFLWFDGQAEEAAKFYVSIFPNSTVGEVTRYTAAGPGPKGSVMTVPFTLDGQEFTGLNSGSAFKFNESISFVVNCESQAEVDSFWAKLTAGGKEVQCGWLKDKFGVSWQIVPIEFMEMLHDKDEVRRDRCMQAMMKMVKLDLAALKKAYAGA